MTILAGYLHNPRVALATAGIVIQTTSLMYTLPTALSASVSTRVGNELGAGQPERARLSTIVAIGMALSSSILGLLWTTLVIVRDKFLFILLGGGTSGYSDGICLETRVGGSLLWAVGSTDSMCGLYSSCGIQHRLGKGVIEAKKLGGKDFM
ncbi:hypothetical protein VNO80_07701 [Phaseolus coccineus]|uniref:MATE efflux family protein n=1 Tax=Phaseolus coccineus TaxID=3886 RepID=A0AAN9NR22_PHACN